MMRRACTNPHRLWREIRGPLRSPERNHKKRTLCKTLPDARSFDNEADTGHSRIRLLQSKCFSASMEAGLQKKAFSGSPPAASFHKPNTNRILCDSSATLNTWQGRGTLQISKRLHLNRTMRARSAYACCSNGGVRYRFGRRAIIAGLL